MTPEQFQRVFPFVRDWIARTLAASAFKTKPVAALNFPRLPSYYSNDLLARAKVVFVDKCPTPPLSALGLNQFAEFENMNANGITYLDTYFILWPEVERESLHFHELVHVVQWQVLGPERFLALYADGLEKQGYCNSPLEVMAYDHEARFNSNAKPYDVEVAVRQQLQAYPSTK
jgi:hypothetical protein